MKIIREILRQRNAVGPRYAKHVTMSQSAFVRLLAEKDAFDLSQVNTQTVPPTVYGMSIRAADDPNTEVAVFAEV